jgi:hypothetical protein
MTRCSSYVHESGKDERGRAVYERNEVDERRSDVTTAINADAASINSCKTPKEGFDFPAPSFSDVNPS